MPAVSATPFHRTQAGFSLVELLIVIVVLIILICLLLPTIAMAKDQAKGMRCRNCLRQLAIGQIAYAQENDGISLVFIANGATTWQNLLPPYLEKPDYVASRGAAGIFYGCPSWIGRIADSGTYDLNLARSGTALASGFAYNYAPGPPTLAATVYNGYNSPGTGTGVRLFPLSQITSQDNRMAFGDANFWDITSSGNFSATDFERCVTTSSNAYFVSRTPRHRSGCNYAMFSGRTIALRKSDASLSFNAPAKLDR